MKKLAGIAVVALFIAAAWMSFRGKPAQVSGRTELQSLMRCAPLAPAVFIGLAQDEDFQYGLNADKGFVDFMDALKTSPTIANQISQFLDALPPEAKKITDSLIDPKNPVGSILEMTVDNFVATAFCIPTIDCSKKETPEFIGVLTLRHASKIPGILDQIKGFERKTVAGKQAYVSEGVFICVADKRVVLSNSETLAAALFEALDGKLPASALPDNQRFRWLSKGSLFDIGGLVVFCDFSAITLNLSKSQRAEFEKFDKVFGFSGAKAFGYFASNQGYRSAKAKMGVVFEGRSLISKLASQKSLHPKSVLKRAIPQADYAVGCAVPTLSKDTLQQLTALFADEPNFAAAVDSPVFAALNGNLKQIDLSASNLIGILQEETPTVCVALSFEDLGKAMGAYPNLQTLIATFFPQKETIDGNTVYSTPGIPGITMSPVHLIQTADQRLVLTNILDAKQALALLNGKGASLLENDEIMVLSDKLRQNALFAGYENDKNIMKLHAAYRKKLAADLPPGSCPPAVRHAAFLDTFADLLKQMDIVFAGYADGSTISCDFLIYPDFDFPAAAKMIRELK